MDVFRPYTLKAIIDIDGVQDILPQKMALWYTEYIKLEMSGKTAKRGYFGLLSLTPLT